MAVTRMLCTIIEPHQDSVERVHETDTGFVLFQWQWVIRLRLASNMHILFYIKTQTHMPTQQIPFTPCVVCVYCEFYPKPNMHFSDRSMRSVCYYFDTNTNNFNKLTQSWLRVWANARILTLVALQCLWFSLFKN